MASVDDRIVAMKFDNNSFQERIAATLTSLDKLKTSLDFSNAKQGVADLQQIGKGFNLEGMAQAIEGISGKFTALGAVAFTVISNITTRAIDAGIQLGKSLSLDQIIGGFKEYETNMNSIQTVLANTKSKGTELNDVNEALDQLNTYSDQTIYNFSQMARNIGTFTAAGIDLDTSVSGIKGIANLAAISGSNAEQASTAMYQLSQALASGSVKLMDWNSVVNAGMGGEVFQKALFDTGKALGTIKDVPMKQTFEEWKDAGNTFRGSLEEGWITADVLTNTLSTFTGDLTEAQVLAMGYTKEQTAGILEMGKTGKEAATKVKTLTQLVSTVKESIGSGWSKSFRTIIGDFEEARTMFTTFNDALGGVISKNADTRNALLTAWAQMGGRRALIAGITNAFEALGGILAPIKAAFTDIFPPMTAMRLVELTRGFRDLMENLKPTPAIAVLMTRIFRGIFAAFAIGIDIVKGIAGVFKDLYDHFKSQDPNKGFLGWVAGIADKVVELQAVLERSNGIADWLKNNVTLPLENFIDNFTIDGLIETIKGWGVKLKAAFLSLFDGEGIDIKVPQALEDLLDRILERFGWLIDVFHAVGAAANWVMEQFNKFKDTLSGALDWIVDKVKNLPTEIGKALSNANYDKGVDAINVGLLAGFVLLVKKFVDSNPLAKLSGLGDKINELFGGLTKTLDAMQTKLKSEALMNIAKALAVLTASMVVLSLIDSGALTKSLVAMGIGFGQLVTVMLALNQITSGPGGGAKLALLASGLSLLGGAMLLMALAMKVFATMSWEEIAKGLVVVTALLGGLTIAIEPLTKNNAGLINVGLGLIAIAVAMNIMALALKSFAEMNWEEMAQGFVAFAGILAAFAIAMKKMPAGKTLLLQGAGIIEIAVAMNIMALALKSFAEMSWEEMAKGMVGFAGVLLVLAIAMKRMPNGASLALQGLGLLAIGIGLFMMAQAIKSLGSMSWEDLGKGLAGVAGILIILGIAAKVMEKSLPGALAIAVMSVSLIALAVALKMISKLSWGQLAKGLVGMAAALLILAVAGQAMTEAIPGLLGLGLALILIGAGLALVGLGLTLIAAAFSVFITTLVQNAGAIISILSELIKQLPAMIAAMGDGLIQLVKKFVGALPEIVLGLGEVLTALLQVFIDHIPMIADAFLALIHEGLRVIREAVPDFINTGLEILIAFLTGIRNNIGEIVTLVAEIITNFLDALAEKVDEIIDSVFNLIIKIIEGVIAKLVDVAKYLLPKGIEFLGGLKDGIVEKAKEVTTWFQELPGKIRGWIGNVLETLFDKGVNLIKGVIDGIEDKIVDVILWFEALPGKIIGWIGNVKDLLLQIGKDIINGLWRGMKAIWEDVKGWFGSITDTITDLKGPPARDAILLYENGTLIMKGLMDGLQEGWDDITPWLAELNPADHIDVNSINKTFAAITEGLEANMDTNPVITPVLDLTNVKAAAGQLGGLLGSYNQAASISIDTTATDGSDSAITATSGPTTIKFEQTINATQPLSASEIYRQTRNQIAMAKEELAIP